MTSKVWGFSIGSIWITCQNDAMLSLYPHISWLVCLASVIPRRSSEQRSCGNGLATHSGCFGGRGTAAWAAQGWQDGASCGDHRG